MNIKEKELFEYIKCPMRFNMIKKGMDIDNNPTFNQIVYQAVKYLYSQTTLDKKVSSATLKNKWDSIAFNNKHLLSPKQVIEGWGLVYRAYEYVTMYDIKFIDIDLMYNMEIPSTGLQVNGLLDPIIDKGDHIEILISSFSKKMPSIDYIDSNMKHTIDAYNIKKMFNKDVVIKYHSFSLGQEVISFRTNKDYDRLESILKNVSTSLHNNILYPRETFLCEQCIGRTFCKEWTGK